jgi:pimeloyl-ACP methyl ester carboxylesterase
MKAGRAIVSVAAGVVGVAAAGAVSRVAAQRMALARRDHVEDVPLGTLRSEPLIVIADDGVSLHVEVDEPDAGAPDVTVIFIHGFALNHDCWHFQRAAYRGLVRTVFYDQRSHGRSGRSSRKNATIDQLGRDLRRVIEAAAPGPVVLIGHSMGGMTVLALAEQAPELFGKRIIGVGLVATTAGGLDVHKMFLPFVPSMFSDGLVRRSVDVLSRGHHMIDSLRRATRSVALVATDQLGFGDDVPEEYVEFVDAMISETSFDVVAAFFPNFDSHDKRGAVGAMADIPTMIVCGTNDQITAFSHSEDLHRLLPHSTLVACPGAGHMVIVERHQQVNSALDQLIAASTAGR